MSSNVRRINLTLCRNTYAIGDKENGTHALLPWDEYEAMREEIERLRAEVEDADEWGR